MYVSMTGFAVASSSHDWGTASLELSSVNHRYQEIYVRLPRELASLEPWFHQRARALFRRGKLQVRVEIAWAAESLAVALNRGVLENYYREIASARDALGVERDISLDALVNLPGVLDMPLRSALGREEASAGAMSALLDEAAKGWNEMRRREGEHLKDAINGHLEDLERHMSEIERLWLGARGAAFEAMSARIGKALEASNATVDESRLVQEIAVIADRWDISEETARMSSHIAKFRTYGEGGESEGRKLDFLVQEMNREVNTINSKVPDTGIRWAAVEAKAAIERMREQIQNLE
ncbi:MAG: YicC family protein [Synergistaceae bacterium]|jgi:uncharacterized protein (TIGR00255 family)|nr:YicC family protein [Synergistaceae bacterium]